MALAEGQSSVMTGPLEMHTQTAIHFAEIITGVKFEVEEITNEKFSVQNISVGKIIGSTSFGQKILGPANLD